MTDQRWDAIVALLSLDNPTPMAASGLKSIAALHGTIRWLLSAVYTIDATVDEPEWRAMRKAENIIGGLPTLFAQLEDELQERSS